MAQTTAPNASTEQTESYTRLGKTMSDVQGELFARTSLPRQPRFFKYGPEDEPVDRRLH